MTNFNFKVQQGEEWRAIPKFQRFLISSHGRVAVLGADGKYTIRNHYKNRHNNNTPIVMMSMDKIHRDRMGIKYNTTRSVKGLVRDAFMPPAPGVGYHCHQKDDDLSNCRLDNLVWRTNSEISKLHAKDRAKRRMYRRLTSAEIQEVKDALAAGQSMNSIAREFNFTVGGISKLMKRERLHGRL